MKKNFSINFMIVQKFFLKIKNRPKMRFWNMFRQKVGGFNDPDAQIYCQNLFIISNLYIKNMRIGFSILNEWNNLSIEAF